MHKRLCNVRTTTKCRMTNAVVVDNRLSRPRNRSVVVIVCHVNVLDDSTAIDSLTGDAGADWYLSALDDLITDLFAGEILDLL